MSSRLSQVLPTLLSLQIGMVAVCECAESENLSFQRVQEIPVIDVTTQKPCPSVAAFVRLPEENDRSIVLLLRANRLSVTGTVATLRVSDIVVFENIKLPLLHHAEAVIATVRMDPGLANKVIAENHRQQLKDPTGLSSESIFARLEVSGYRFQ